MCFNALPHELFLEVIKHYMSDPAETVTAQKRLAHTLVLAQIDHLFRERVISPSCQDLWSTIHLQWPAEIVELYLLRSGGGPLSVFLKTMEAGTKKRKLKQKRWADFLRTNMCVIKHLDLCISNKQCSPELAETLYLPAPILQSLALALGAKVELLGPYLFLGKAPNLTSVYISSPLPFDLGDLLAIRVLRLRLLPQHLTRVAKMLTNLTNIEELSLIGYVEHCPSRPPEIPDEKLSLPSCKTLYFKNLDSDFLHHFLSSIDFPSLEDLGIHEKASLGDDTWIISRLMWADFPCMPTRLITPTSVRFELNPDQIYITADGVPSYTYSIGLRPAFGWFEYDRNDRYLATFETLLTILPNQLSAEPRELIINNNLYSGPPQHDSPLQMIDHSILWQNVLASYRSVEKLRVSGSIPAVAGVIYCSQAHLPLLSELHIEIEDGNLVSDSDWKTLSALCQSRASQVLILGRGR
ncbi:hypothetical protein SISSUDRAFT_1123756 [Sistotremastrum suecicum HHB10207 ss-3]|uniref:F-box domain-containing protein n=1 Tax=Sistotremastrum suecicum HHB10207 ss-3 TaxID=1314776 RepID=A0A165WX96_9AGAM|nr:hypothetical protein SISSUDRAFT_1123756 [Sistotremastrum suecicum HHB10207 ss-3]